MVGVLAACHSVACSGACAGLGITDKPSCGATSAVELLGGNHRDRPHCTGANYFIFSKKKKSRRSRKQSLQVNIAVGQ